MHIPDGFLDAKTWVTLSAASAVGLGLALRQNKRRLTERDVPVLGMLGAFVFAAQMVNFPVAAGTSGHLMGAALVTAMRGPWAASVVMSAVVIIQALVFRDGGVTALGANVFNMAILAPWLAWLVLRLVPPAEDSPQPGAVFVAGLASMVGAAAAAALELAASGTAPLALVLPAMLAWHILIGIGEGAISAATVAYLVRAGHLAANSAE